MGVAVRVAVGVAVGIAVGVAVGHAVTLDKKHGFPNSQSKRPTAIWTVKLPLQKRREQLPMTAEPNNKVTKAHRVPPRDKCCKIAVPTPLLALPGHITGVLSFARKGFVNKGLTEKQHGASCH